MADDPVYPVLRRSTPRGPVEWATTELPYKAYGYNDPIWRFSITQPPGEPNIYWLEQRRGHLVQRIYLSGARVSGPDRHIGTALTEY